MGHDVLGSIGNDELILVKVRFHRLRVRGQDVALNVSFYAVRRLDIGIARGPVFAYELNGLVIKDLGNEIRCGIRFGHQAGGGLLNHPVGIVIIVVYVLLH